MMPKQDDNISYPSGLKFVLLMLSIFAAMFLVSLDKLIISTAIPQITNTFNSQDDVGWYGTAYLLTNCAFQLVFGKLYRFLNIKATFLTSIVMFETGSALCAAAPTSIAFILGRAIAGLGAGGVLSGVMVIMVYAMPLHKRPKYQGFFGAIFGLSSVLGPTVGGVFTTDITWRWCFYINLPIGGVVIALVFLLLHIPDRPSTKIDLKEKLRQLNLLGSICLVPGIVCLCLALQWGGTTYDWNNGRIIAVFVISFVLLIAFAFIQVSMPEQAILPPRIFIQRSIASGFWTSLCMGAHQTLFLYYLPIWFQAIKGTSAITSGVDLLPMVLPIVAASIGNGYFTTYIRYYTPSLIFGVCLTAIGAGLLTTLGLDTSKGKWVGYQIVYGFGLGCASQAPNLAAQTVLSREDVGIGASLMFFGQTLFGAVFVSVGQNVLDNQLAERLSVIPGITTQLITNTGATNILNNIPNEYHTAALEAYNVSLRHVFQIALCMACLAILGAICMEFRTIKKKGPPLNTTNATEEGVASKAHAYGVNKESAEPKTTSEAEESKVTTAIATNEKTFESKDLAVAN